MLIPRWSPADQLGGLNHPIAGELNQFGGEQNRLIIAQGANTDAVTPALVTEIMGSLLKAQQPTHPGSDLTPSESGR